MTSLQEQLQSAMAELAEHTERIQEVQKELGRARASATSKDRMVTATVSAHGEITDLKFHTEDYRDMPSAQLAAVLMATVNEARAAMSAQVGGKVRPLMRQQDSLVDGMFGGSSVEDLLAPLRAMRPRGLADTVLGDGGRPPKPARTYEDEEEFDG
ncbi:YbaB/EbfC family nucleoid-associated protein [Streptomyces varsoviensis]|uniref:YbaB/EbfC family nucleoid-associated protein n=1 Tax=Streptomyces varsoviensis TaxID=67373 RepID=UPI0033DEEE37